MTKNEALTHAFSAISNAERMKAKYAKYLAKIPTDKWVRCKDIDDNYRAVGKLMNGLRYAGAVQSRTVDDGIIKVPDEEYRYENNEPPYVTAYDIQGNIIGRVPNPQYKGSRGHWVSVEREIHASHTEYKLLPLD